ncbi:hypothetical protein LSH36_236g01011, partial [Paralvinella palmiformis]
ATRFRVQNHKATNITYISYKHLDEERLASALSLNLYHVGEIFDDIDNSYCFFHCLTMQIIDGNASE